MVRSDRRMEAAPTLRHRVTFPVREDPPRSELLIRSIELHYLVW